MGDNYGEHVRLLFVCTAENEPIIDVTGTKTLNTELANFLRNEFPSSTGKIASKLKLV